MLARDLAVDLPSVRMTTLAIDAARLLAGERLPGLIVLDEAGRPATILPGTDVLAMAVPAYCQSDPTLARVIDEAAADVFIDHLGDKTVAEVLPKVLRDLPVVDHDATLLEVASVIARSRSPLVAVVDADKLFIGAVTLDALLDRALTS